MRSCRSICDKDEVLGGTGLVEAGTYIAILLGTILAGVLAARPAVGRRRRCSASPFLGYLAGRQVPPAPPAAERLPITWHIVHASIELVSATMHIRAAVPRHPRDQLLLDDRRGADHHLPAAGEERARRRTSRSRACSSPSSRSASRSGRSLINRLLKSEVSARFAPALGDRDGRVRPAASLRVAGLGQARARADDARQFPLPSDGRPDDPRAARGRDHRRHVRGAALRLPDDDGAQDRDGAHGRGQQYRQFGRDGDRRAARLRAQQPRASARSASCCWSRRCAWFPPGSAGSSTSPATEQFSRARPRRRGSRRRRSSRTA